MTEFNLEDAKKVWFEEGLEEGWEKGMEKGQEVGRNNASFEIVQKAFAKGLPIDVISDITGLDINTIKTLGATEHR